MTRPLSAAEAKAFAERWLPAWSGNRPELLASFYSEDALYLDPGVPGGAVGWMRTGSARRSMADQIGANSGSVRVRPAMLASTITPTAP